MFLACLALCAISGCAATSDRSDVACDEPNVITNDAGDAGGGDASEPDASAPVRVRTVYPETNACYPSMCGRGLREFGPCSCPDIESACRTQYGNGYAAVCPALQTWARACIDGPNPDAGATPIDALRCYPQACTELREDGGICSCRAVMSACLVAFGGNESCPALKGWARACLAP